MTQILLLDYCSYKSIDGSPTLKRRRRLPPAASPSRITLAKSLRTKRWSCSPFQVYISFDLIPVRVQSLIELAFAGAFTPSCSASHLPGYIQKLSEIKSKGVDIVAVIAYNDPYVMSAWGKANGVKENDIVSIRPS